MMESPLPWSLIAALAAMLVYLKSHAGVRKSLAISFSVLLFAYLGLLAAFLLADYFTNRGIDESVLYHLEAGLRGAGIGEYQGLIMAAVVLCLVSLLLPTWLYFHGRSAHSGRPRWFAITGPVLLVAAIALLPTAHSLFAAARPASTKLAFNDYYVPLQMDLRLENPRNLLILYLEGLERTYLDESAFPGLTPQLGDLLAEHLVYTDIAEMPFTQWTIAGLVASQCGLPLISPSHGNSMSGMRHYLAKARCLGDLLAANGYQLHFMGGADTEFAGKGKFLSTHGYTTVEGRDELGPIMTDPRYLSPWGLYDDTLFSMALDRYQELVRADQPFALTLLTLDTHHPSGIPSRSCDGLRYGDGANPALNAVACSDKLAARFIRDLMATPGADRLLIAVVSDHLSMKNTVHRELAGLERRLLFAIIEPGRENPQRVTNPGTIFDVGPTILSHLGLDLPLGLGRNLQRGTSVSRTTPGFENAIPAWRPEVSSFWAFPNLSTGVTVHHQRRSLEIDGEEFDFPTLIEFDEALDSNLYFEFDNSTMHRTLRDHYTAAAFNRGLLWVDHCRDIRSDEVWQQDDYCLLLGRKGGASPSMIPLEGSLTLSGSQLRELF